MNRSWLTVAAVTVLGMSLMRAQVTNGRGDVVIRLDPALDTIVSTRAVLEPLKEDFFEFTEGPVWSRQGGYLLFSDTRVNKVYKWRPDGELSVFLDRSGFTGTGPLIVTPDRGSMGSNGLALDAQGRLILCAQGDRALVRLEKDGTRTVLADRYQGKRLNGPNDVVMKSDGSFYFTDRGSGLRGNAQMELPFHAIMRWKNDTLEVLDEGDVAEDANGLAFSPDEKYLYVASTGRIMRYDVRADGTVTSPRLLIDPTTDTSAPGRPDGFKVDLKGNIFTGAAGGIWIVSPAGTILGKILLPLPAANLAFGDADGRGLYITARSGLYRIRLNDPAI